MVNTFDYSNFQEDGTEWMRGRFGTFHNAKGRGRRACVAGGTGAAVVIHSSYLIRTKSRARVRPGTSGAKVL